MLLTWAALYVLACAGCATCQRRMIYFPPAIDPAIVGQLGRDEGLNRWSNASGEPIGWKRLSVTQPASGQVLVLHGNAGCAFQCSQYADAIQQVSALDVFMIEYPGYADRPGKPTEQTLNQAAEEGFQLLSTDEPLYVVGESLGTGVAAFLAGKYPAKVSGLALLAPYNSLADVAQAHVKIFPVRWFLQDQFPSEDYLRSYRGPVAVLVGKKDTVIPAKFGRRLYDRYAGPKRLWEFPESDHDRLMTQPPQVWRQIIEFWQAKTP